MTPWLDERLVAGLRVVRIPALLRGRAVMPAWPTVGETSSVLRAGRVGRLEGPTGSGAYLLLVRDRESSDPQVLVAPALDPASLPEPAPARTVRRLMDLSTDDLTAAVDQVGAGLAALLDDDEVATRAAGMVGDDPTGATFLRSLPALFDGAAVRRLLEQVLHAVGPVTDDWVAVPALVEPGMSARAATALGLSGTAGPGARPRPGPELRAVPTTQLHVTAGNAPVVPFVSLLWGWAARGACVVKSATEAAGLTSLLAPAIVGLGEDHPLATATSLAHWPGGDPQAEGPLLRPGAFDRRVVWGGDDAVASLVGRGPGTDTIMLGTRYGVSLVRPVPAVGPGGDDHSGGNDDRPDRDDDRAGGDDRPDDRPSTLAALAVRGAIDSLVANQAGCTSSLLHLVEGDPGQVWDYARELCQVLAAWDQQIPAPRPPEAIDRLLTLRRGALAGARWLVNGDWPAVTSAVVVHDGWFDLARHPGGRVVVVTGSTDLDDLLGRLGPSIGTVGVAPDRLRRRVRDDVAARGVNAVVPLGSAEAGYAGRPHDGMEVVSRLVRWVNG